MYGLPTAARGELERMTEDDYADYVRQKMWEKTHAGQREEHARREERRAAAAREKVEADRAAALVEASLARGEERRRMLAGRAVSPGTPRPGRPGTGLSPVCPGPLRAASGATSAPRPYATSSSRAST